MTIKPLLLTITLIIICVGSSFSQQQTKNVKNQCDKFGQKDFVDGVTSFNFVNANLKDILNKITDEFGCNFIVDKSVKIDSITIKIEDVPWNVALEAILESQDLGIQINGNVLRVADIRTLEEEKKPKKIITDFLENERSLFTEFIKIKKPSEAKSDHLKNIQTILFRRLTKRGSIEIDEKSSAFVVTDVRENLDAIINLVKLIEILDTKEPSPLYTEFIKLNYLIACDNCFHGCTFDKNPSPLPPFKLVKLMGKLLSRRGAIETDSRSNSIIITDTKERITSIRKQVEEWDKPDTDLDEIIRDFESKNKVQKLK